MTGHERNLKDRQLSDPGIPQPPQPRRRGRPSRASLAELQLSSRKHGRESLDKGERTGESIEGETDSSDQEWPQYEGGAEALRQDPLYVLQVSLWSEDGSEVRNMIATPRQSDPPRLTRILMGAIVVSPTLLLNEVNQLGWYFSFPDLSVRTEGVYTLKFSLMQFAKYEKRAQIILAHCFLSLFSFPLTRFLFSACISSRMICYLVLISMKGVEVLHRR
jgi:hypothetical protein